jgi:hypothetical protein
VHVRRETGFVNLTPDATGEAYFSFTDATVTPGTTVYYRYCVLNASSARASAYSATLEVMTVEDT